jgi:hypothetical protein
MSLTSCASDPSQFNSLGLIPPLLQGGNSGDGGGGRWCGSVGLQADSVGLIRRKGIRTSGPMAVDVLFLSTALSAVQHQIHRGLLSRLVISSLRR